jgi:hypothetical protein
MNETILPILQNPAVMHRTSAATRRVLEERASPVAHTRYLVPELYAVLQQVVDTILPQGVLGTQVDIAVAMDKRLADGKGDGWRFADLPANGEAYRVGLGAIAPVFAGLSVAEREAYLRSVANGDEDAAGFPLSKWLLMVRTDAVRVWMSHPAVMQKMEYYGFADGATGQTDGPTASEGWEQITPETGLTFETERVSASASQRVSGVVSRDEWGAL